MRGRDRNQQGDSEYWHPHRSASRAAFKARVSPPMPPIALTDAQLAMITAAAKPLHACDRTPFLEAVAAARLHGVEIGDGVVRETQRSFFRAPVLDADNSTTTTTNPPRHGIDRPRNRRRCEGFHQADHARGRRLDELGNHHHRPASAAQPCVLRDADLRHQKLRLPAKDRRASRKEKVRGTRWRRETSCGGSTPTPLPSTARKTLSGAVWAATSQRPVKRSPP